MLLTLMRHGEAQSSAASDAVRQLTRRGRSDNLSTLSALLQHKPRYSHALHSPYDRARETAEDVCATIQGLTFAVCDLLTPNASLQELLSYLENYANKEEPSSLLLVGHNPLLSSLLALLLDGQQNEARYLDTSNLVCLNVGVMAPACAELNYWLRPE